MSEFSSNIWKTNGQFEKGNTFSPSNFNFSAACATRGKVECELSTELEKSRFTDASLRRGLSLRSFDKQQKCTSGDQKFHRESFSLEIAIYNTTFVCTCRG